MIEHVQPVGEVGDHLHVVLHPEDRYPRLVLDAQDEAREVFSRVAVQAGRRLVEQQHRRLHRECAREADDLLLRERQIGHAPVAQRRQLDEIEHLLASTPVNDLGFTHRSGEQRLGQRPRSDARVTPDEQVLQDREMREQFAVLESARDADAGDRVRPSADEIVLVETDAARLRTIDAADAVQHARLSGAVRSDEREQFARAQCERHVVEHGQSAEMQRHALQRNDDIGRRKAANARRRLSHTISGCAGTA